MTKKKFDVIKMIRKARERMYEEYMNDPKAFRARIKKQADSWRAQRKDGGRQAA